MHHSQRKRRIGARKRLYMLVSGTSGQRANGINDNHTGTLALGFAQKEDNMGISGGSNPASTAPHIISLWLDSQHNAPLGIVIDRLPARSTRSSDPDVHT